MSMYIGEALAGDGSEIAHIDLLIGSKDGPVGVAFANALARQSAGHSNLLAVLASVAASMWEKFDHTRDEGVRALSPMMPAVSSNLDSVGVPQAVAGPYVRGDIGTVRKHLEAVSSSAPEYLALYIELALAGLPFAVEKGALAPERSQEIKELLESYRSTDSI